MRYQTAVELLKKENQLQLLRFYDELDEGEKEALLQQIEAIDFHVIDLIREKDHAKKDNAVYEPLSALTVDEIARHPEYEEMGLQAIREGKTAAVLLAGGQGSRLGFQHAKGMYNVGITRDLYIFECLFNNLKKVTDKAGALIPLLIMTSDINDAETRAFLKAHDYFGYDPNFVYFFVQDMAPCVDFDGKILLSEKGKVATSPNGNGGWFSSLKKAGLLEKLHEMGVTYLSAFGVDNVLQKINDPAFIGATIASDVNVGAMVVRKASPTERVGVICRKNGCPSVVEYYEMTDDMVNLRDENGALLYNYGVILNYLFRLSALEKADKELTVHFAEKKIAYVNDAGELVTPEENTGYKFEKLILDLVEQMETCLPFEVEREKAFAPIKNATGIDSVESARALLEKNGVKL